MACGSRLLQQGAGPLARPAACAYARWDGDVKPAIGWAASSAGLLERVRESSWPRLLGWVAAGGRLAPTLRNGRAPGLGCKAGQAKTKRGKAKLFPFFKWDFE